MGARKRLKAEQLKKEKQSTYFAILKNCPVPPRKMRLIGDMIQGEEVNRALDLLKFCSKKGAKYAEKTLMSAIANWQNKNEGKRLESSQLFVQKVNVNEGRTLKRLRPAAMGRANIIRRRANHLSIYIDSLESINQPAEEPVTTSENNNETNKES